jgi:hypothetical protein
MQTYICTGGPNIRCQFVDVHLRSIFGLACLQQSQWDIPATQFDITISSRVATGGNNDPWLPGGLLQMMTSVAFSLLITKTHPQKNSGVE